MSRHPQQRWREWRRDDGCAYGFVLITYSAAQLAAPVIFKCEEQQCIILSGDYHGTDGQIANGRAVGVEYLARDHINIEAFAIMWGVAA